MIETVLGPVEATAFGAASMHEHLLSDSTVLHAPAREPLPADPRVTMANLGFVRWNLLALEDNLRLDDPAIAAAELAPLPALGQRGLVDLTSWGLGPRYADLPALSRGSGVHIAVGYGAYLGRSHPSWLAEASEDALEDLFFAALTEEISGCGYRAALLGILGTSKELQRGEVKVLRAAGRAAARTGAAATVRLDPAARLGPVVLDLLAAEGLPPDRVVFGNVDEFIDGPYLRELADAGATLEWCFGNEAYYRDGYKDATDAERLDGLGAFLADGHADRIVLGCSVWTKSQLSAFGGMGYGHLLGRIVPVLRDRGVSDGQVDAMLVANPARLLDRPPV
ncbi:phosphotriesterase-related protein [Actinocorallia herbida]|uniref:Phosphotriesterase-related protein n=1 Tax=Actinocorallia herbida TaxID=58109 RepID=A0A3N1D6N8_9ACTN|nr:phosphotriesterase [Actinocorallia herbida]ROO89129.1 phosphotriesterase-related protein [Actinocorallia herbida]